MAELLLTLVIVFDIVLIATAFVLIHYLGIDALTSLLYVGNEGCDPSLGSVGYHCFGDYNLGSVMSLPNPWDVVTQLGPWNYPAASMVPSYIFVGLGNLTGHPSATMVLYLLVMAAGMTLPAAWAARGRAVWLQISLWAMFGFLSVPALMALDRGNVVGLAVAVMFLAVIGVARDRPLLVSIGIALAACAKPQFGLAIFIFVFFGRWMWMLICAGIALVCQVVPFLLWPQHFPGTIVQAVLGLFSFGGQSTLGNTIPSSVSFAKGAYLLEEWFVRPFRPGSANWVEGHQALVTGVIVLALLVVLFLARRAMPQALTLSLLFLISALAVPTSFTYYFVAALPLAAIVLRDPAVRRSERTEDLRLAGVLELGERRGWAEFSAAAFFTVTLAATISRVFYPEPIPTMPFFVFTTSDVVTILWMVAIPWYALARRRARKPPAASRETHAVATV